MTRRAAAPFLLLCGALAGCGGPAPPPPAQATRDSPGIVRNVRTVRIVVMAPGAAEMLDSLGLADRIVGVGDYVDWPVALRRLPKLGAYDAPNEERVLALRAAALITSAGTQGSASLAHLRGLGVEVIRLDLDTFDGTLAAFLTLGDRFGRQQRARELVGQMRRRLARVERLAQRATPRRVLLVVGRDPLYVAGTGSYLDRLVALAGGRNVVADSRAPYELTSLEVVLNRQPEVILDTAENVPGSPFGRRLGSWSRWPFLPAVRERRVFLIDPWRLNIPGPRLPEMAELMGKLIHPEIFGAVTDEELGPPPLPASAAGGRR